MAADLLRSALAGLAQPERVLCLRLGVGGALARAGRLPEALGAFRGAARLEALRPEELGELTGGPGPEWPATAGREAGPRPGVAERGAVGLGARRAA